MSLKRKMERRRMTELMITNVEVIVRLENKTALLWRNLKSGFGI